MKNYIISFETKDASYTVRLQAPDYPTADKHIDTILSRLLLDGEKALVTEDLGIN